MLKLLLLQCNKCKNTKGWKNRNIAKFSHSSLDKLSKIFKKIIKLKNTTTSKPYKYVKNVLKYPKYVI